MVSILTPTQITALKLIAQTSLAQKFYFSGGTALAHYYLQHRKSEDLDFFSQEEFDPQSVTIILKTLKKTLEFTALEFQNSFNRNLYFLKFENAPTLKLEFTFYPFQQIETPTQKDGLFVDSAIDITANKLFTISQKPRGRDYFDLYCLVKKYAYDLENIRMLAKQKFDWHIDPLQLASKLYEVDQHLDDPIVVREIKKSDIINFFQHSATALKNEILSK